MRQPFADRWLFVERAHRSRVIAGQYIVIANLRGYVALVVKSPIAAMEQILNRLLELHDRACQECRGTNRQFQPVDVEPIVSPLAEIEVYRVGKPELGWH